MTPAAARRSLKVVATETLSNTASTATPGEARALVQRHAELLVGLEQLRIDLVQALRPVLACLGRGVVGDRLVVDGRVAARAPSAARACEPVPQRLQAPVGRNCGSPFLREISRTTSSSRPGRHGVGLDVGDEAVLVAAADQGLQLPVGVVCRFTHERTGVRLPTASCRARASASARGQRPGPPAAPD